MEKSKSKCPKCGIRVSLANLEKHMETRCRKREAMFPRIVICSQCGIKVGRDKLFDHMEKTCRQRPEVVEARAAKKEAASRQAEDKLVAKFGKCPKCDDHKTSSGYCMNHTCFNFRPEGRCYNYKPAGQELCDSCTASDKRARERAEWWSNFWPVRAVAYLIVNHPNSTLLAGILIFCFCPLPFVFYENYEKHGSIFAPPEKPGLSFPCRRGDCSKRATDRGFCYLHFREDQEIKEAFRILLGRE